MAVSSLTVSLPSYVTYFDDWTPDKVRKVFGNMRKELNIFCENLNRVTFYVIGNGFSIYLQEGGAIYELYKFFYDWEDTLPTTGLNGVIKAKDNGILFHHIILRLEYYNSHQDEKKKIEKKKLLMLYLLH